MNVHHGGLTPYLFSRVNRAVRENWGIPPPLTDNHIYCSRRSVQNTTLPKKKGMSILR